MQQVAQQWHKTNTSAGIKKAALVAWSDNAFWYVQPDAWLPTAELKHQKTKNWRGSEEKIQACNVIASHIFLGSLLCTGQSMSSDGQSSGWISLSLSLSLFLHICSHWTQDRARNKLRSLYTSTLLHGTTVGTRGGKANEMRSISGKVSMNWRLMSTTSHAPLEMKVNIWRPDSGLQNSKHHTNTQLPFYTDCASFLIDDTSSNRRCSTMKTSVIPFCLKLAMIYFEHFSQRTSLLLFGDKDWQSVSSHFDSFDSIPVTGFGGRRFLVQGPHPRVASSFTPSPNHLWHDSFGTPRR